MVLTLHEYTNSTVVKLKNRRVIVRDNPDIKDSLIMEFKILSPTHVVGATIFQRHLGKGVHFCGLTISHESAIALIACLQNELQKNYKDTPPAV